MFPMDISRTVRLITGTCLNITAGKRILIIGYSDEELNGRVVDVVGGKEADFLTDRIAELGENSDRIAELGIGTNYKM
jgi:hypothetical protein